MKCAICKTKLEPGEKFCTTCRNPVEHVICPHCGSAKVGTVFCSACGKKLPEHLRGSGDESYTHKPPNTADMHYPRRMYNVKLEEMVGWRAEKAIAALGEPDSKSKGRMWPPVEQWDSEGKLNLYYLADCGEYVKDCLPGFGPRTTKIQVPIPYEEWTYHNVQGSTWILYLTPGGIFHLDEAVVPLELLEQHESNRGFWQKLGGIFQTARTREPPWIRLYKRPRLKLSGPLAVAEVKGYPTGAHF
jgi:hypothetical protein